MTSNYPTREHYKNAYFPVTLPFDPHLVHEVHDQFSLTKFRRLIAKDV